MNRLKDLWSGQDLINRIILISGVAVFIWCLIKGQGMYGLVILLVMAFLMISRFNSLTKRRGRLYTAFLPFVCRKLLLLFCQR